MAVPSIHTQGYEIASLMSLCPGATDEGRYLLQSLEMNNAIDDDQLQELLDDMQTMKHM